jgi:hypothetical protein
MKKILAHTCNHRLYNPLIQQLSEQSKLSVNIKSLHGSIFDSFHQLKPDIVILTIYEYTQEFHTFVNTMKSQTEIIIFMADAVHQDLMAYCEENNIKTIQEQKSDIKKNVIPYLYLYDNKMYKNLFAERNDKFLVILSPDNSINNYMLQDILYPTTKLKVALINNPEFKHNQNIGLANSYDLMILMNKFYGLIDLTKSYSIEAQLCGIKNINIENDLKENITKNIVIDTINDIENYSIEKFVSDKLLPLIGD